MATAGGSGGSGAGGAGGSGAGGAGSDDSYKYGETDEMKKANRELRQKYRRLYQDIDENREELLTGDLQCLTDKVEEANELFKSVTTPREAALDSHLINELATFGQQRAQALHTNLVTFQPMEFAEKLITAISGHLANEIPAGENPIPDENWVTFGKMVSSLRRKAPSFHFMLGSFDKGKLIQKPRRQRAENAKTVEEKQTKDVSAEKLSKGELKYTEKTTEEVERILEILRRLYKQHGPICYFEFVANPHSFGKTIENIFYVSFLVKDNLVKIYLDDDKLPVIAPVEETEDGASAQPGKQEQVIISLTKKEWEEIITVFKIKKAAIPDRPKENINTPSTSTS